MVSSITKTVSWLPFLLYLSSTTLQKHSHVNALSVSTPKNQLQLDVQKSRNFIRTGIASGGGIIVASAALGVSIGLVDPAVVLTGTVVGSAAFAAFVESNNQRNKEEATSSKCFQVKESLIHGAGMGLFCTQPLPKGVFLFPYDGEKLSEDEYFRRYPTGQGRYVAEVPTATGDPVYIDGIDPDQSGLARWMNSKPLNEANVEWRKQSFGPEAGSMYFYARRDILKDEELAFDYGSNYWDAVEEDESE